MTENRSAQQHSAPKQGANAAQAQSAPQTQPALAVELAKDNSAAKAAPQMRPDVTAEAAAGNRKSFFKRS